MAPTNTETHEYAALYSEADSEVRSILAAVSGILDAKRMVEEKLAAVVVRMRKSIKKETTSKNTGKTVTVPVWDGRSPAYREWYKDHFLVILEELVTDQRLRSLIRTNVQNLVQTLVKKEATQAEKKHLGLTNAPKGRTPKPAPSNDGDANDNDIRTIVDYPMVQEAASLDILAAQVTDLTAHLITRVEERKDKLSKGERDRFLKQSQQALTNMIAARSAVIESGKKTPAAKKETAKV